MAVVGSVVANVSANTANFEAGMKRSSGATKQFQKDMRFASQVLKGFGAMRLAKQVVSIFDAGLDRAKDKNLIPPETQATLDKASSAVERLKDAFALVVVEVVSKLTPAIEYLLALLPNGGKITYGKDLVKLTNNPFADKANNSSAERGLNAQQRDLTDKINAATDVNNFTAVQSLLKKSSTVLGQQRLARSAREAREKEGGSVFGSSVASGLNVGTQIFSGFAANAKDALAPIAAQVAESVQAGINAFNQLADDAKNNADLFKKTRTPQEKFAKEQDRLNLLLARGAIDQDLYNRAIEDARDQFGVNKDKDKKEAADPFADIKTPEALIKGSAAAFSAINRFEVGTKKSAAEIKAEEQRVKLIDAVDDVKKVINDKFDIREVQIA